jgi:phage terminase large subunit-like protein
VHGAIIDEVHVHKNPDLIDALETGTGSREQPLIGFITTADAGKDGSDLRDQARVPRGPRQSGSIVDPTWYAVVFGVDDTVEGFDPFSDETIATPTRAPASPSRGTTSSPRRTRPRQSPAQLNRYLRLHLNVRTKQLTRWLPIERYDATGQLIDDAEWKGKVVTGGLDLSTSSDFTAFAFRPRRRARASGALVLYWLPGGTLDDPRAAHEDAAAALGDEGWLRSPRATSSTTPRCAPTSGRGRRLGVVFSSIAYDPWNASETVRS